MACPALNETIAFGVCRYVFQYASFALSSSAACSIGIPASQSAQRSTSVSPGNCGASSRSTASSSIAAIRITLNVRSRTSNRPAASSSAYFITTGSPDFTLSSSASQRLIMISSSRSPSPSLAITNEYGVDFCAPEIEFTRYVSVPSAPGIASAACAASGSR